jgi:hypothetical protein
MMIATHWGTGQSDGTTIDQLLTMNEVLQDEKQEVLAENALLRAELAEQAKQLATMRAA